MGDRLFESAQTLMKLFLDDIRIPAACANYMYKRIGDENPIYLEAWFVVRNYDKFVEFIKAHAGEITHISFDHDLADAHYDPKTWTEGFVYHEKTGYDCAKFMKDYYTEKSLPFPKLYVHSMNPVGTENIVNLFKS